MSNTTGPSALNGHEPTSSRAACARCADEESPLLTHRSSDSGSSKKHEEFSSRKLIVVLGSAFIGVFLAALDTTIVATLSVPISSSFKSLNLLSWLGSSYLIANAACQPLSGRLTDIFSRRSGLIVSNLLFFVGTLMCGLATSKWSILAGRVVAGMGGGGMNAISAFLASDLVPLKRRGVVQGVAHVCYGVGAGLGGLFGGWVNDVWGWRAAFLGRLPLIFVSGLLICVTVSNNNNNGDRSGTQQSRGSRISRIDFSGALTLVATLVLLLLGLNSGGNVVKWSHPLVLVSLSLSIVALVLFVCIESRWAKEPIIPMRLLLDRTVLAACFINCLITMTLFMATFYVPVFLQVNGASTTSSGLRLIPQSVGTSIASLGCGYIMKRTGKYRTLGLVVISCSSFGFAGLATMTFDMGPIPALVYLFLVGIGYGGMLSVSLLGTVAAVPHQDQAVATSIIYAFRSVGSTMGVTVASTVYQNLLQRSLHARFDGRQGAAGVIKRILDSLDELKHLPRGWSDGVYASYGTALRGVFLTGLGVAGLGLVAASFMRQHKLHDTISREDDE
ncbi:hypothetical protein QQS21_004263 [Conoideocrella luteorostrata]|uniref:Major facilitator superfamily (MFS) profile domain-containing protein n=1 Tax=Conoideocrella luteorostrata TaxID=1105319 RepID=A0AAJ0G1Q8_9HYPO|nr:hypothetical protein QQS21_004263 [Conoideocrella luteorostrata]